MFRMWIRIFATYTFTSRIVIYKLELCTNQLLVVQKTFHILHYFLHQYIITIWLIQLYIYTNLHNSHYQSTCKLKCDVIHPTPRQINKGGNTDVRQSLPINKLTQGWHSWSFCKSSGCNCYGFLNLHCYKIINFRITRFKLALFITALL